MSVRERYLSRRFRLERASSEVISAFPIVARWNRQFAQFTVHRIYGGVFYDAGNTWNDSGLEGLSTNRLRQDAGFELRVDTSSFFSFPAAFQVMGAYGFSEPEAETWRWYSSLLFCF